MTDEMIEHVARALRSAMGGESGLISDSAGETVAVDDVFDTRAIARAAIAAMKTPTEAMIWAGRQADDAAFFTEDIWCAMISAALGEKGGGT